MTLEAVLQLAVKGVEQTNHGPVGRDQNVPSVRTELKAGPVAVDFRLEFESGEGSLVESPEIVELDDVGFHADAEDESFGIESGDGARREIHEPLTIVAAEIPQPKGGIQGSRNEEIVGRRHGQTGDSVRMPRKVTDIFIVMEG